MRIVVPDKSKPTKSAPADSQARGVLGQLYDFGNEKLKPEKEKKKYNWKHALVAASDETSCDGQSENDFRKNVNDKHGKQKSARKSSAMVILDTLSELMESSGAGSSGMASHGACDAERAKMMDARLMRIAEEQDQDIVFEPSFGSPSAQSLNRIGSSSSQQIHSGLRLGHRPAFSDDHSELMSFVSEPATEIMGNLTSKLTPTGRGDDNMDLLSFFSEPATEIMGNLTSSGIRQKDSNESSLHGERFLSDIGTQETKDDESLFSDEGKPPKKKKNDPKSDELVPGTPRTSNKGGGLEAAVAFALSQKENQKTANGSKSYLNTGIYKKKESGKDEGTSSQQQAPNSRQDAEAHKFESLTVPRGTDDTTEHSRSVDHSTKVQAVRHSICMTFAVCALLVFVAAVIFVGVALPKMINESKASSSSPTMDVERSTAIWNLAESVSGADSLDDIGSPAFQAIEWMMRTDEGTETSSDILKERFIVSLLYFATSGDKWKQKTNFLSGKSICSWHTTVEKDGLANGIACDSESRVTKIILGTYLFGIVFVTMSNLLENL